MSKSFMFHQNVSKWIKSMLTLNEMRLKDIPRDVRIYDSGVYTAAFRMSSTSGTSCKRFVQDLEILLNDICCEGSESIVKDDLIGVLYSALYFNDHREEKELEYFLETIPETILQKLRVNDEKSGNFEFGEMFRKLKTIE